MFERSEFGPRAPPPAKRRGPIRRSRIGSRPATAVLVTFAATKVTRATARKLLLLSLLFPSGRLETVEQRQGLLVAARPSSFLKDQKGTKKSFRRTRSGAATPRRPPALLARCGTAPKLAALKHGRLFGRTGLRCSARFTAHKIKCKSNNSNSNSNSRSSAIRSRPALPTPPADYRESGRTDSPAPHYDASPQTACRARPACHGACWRRWSRG